MDQPGHPSPQPRTPAPAPKGTSKLTLAAIGCAGLLGLCCMGTFVVAVMGGRKPIDPAEMATITSEIDTTFAKIHALGDACPSPRGVPPIVCDDAAIRSKHEAPGVARLYVDAIHHDSLARFRSKLRDDWTAKRHEMSWIDSITIRDARRAEDVIGFGAAIGNMRYSIGKLAKRRFVAVFRAAKEAMPVADGDSFFGGVFDGGIFIMDLETASVAGQVPLHVENSDEVRYRSKGVLKKTFQQACEDDFKKQFQKSATQALRKISKEIYISSASTIGD